MTSAGHIAATLAQELSARADISSQSLQSYGIRIAIESPATVIIISEPTDPRVQLFRPKSVRNHQEYHRQWSSLKSQGMEPALHGGRRAMARMLEAITRGAKIRPISFLTTQELAQSVLLKKPVADKELEVDQKLVPAPIYIADKDLLNTIRGQKLNVGDAILAMVQFPMVSKLEELLAHPPILILENVRNAENVGSILRTAFCLGITSIVASATAWAAFKDSRAARCSMGTMYYNRYYKTTDSTCDSFQDESSLVSTIRKLQQGGIRVYGIEIGEDAKAIAPHGANRNWAAVMGNEDVGLSSHVGSACDQMIYIPQAHGDSLNVGHAAAIAMFELGRETPTPDHDGLAACT